MSSRLASAILLAVCVAQAIVSATVDPDQADPTHHLSERWYHDENHSVHTLFRRGGNDGIIYSPIGSPDWAQGFPADPALMQNMPQAWLDALHAAIAAGKIPDIPVTTMGGPSPTYPDGYDPMSPNVCSSSYQCRIPGDIWDGPPGTLSLSFDDGPLPPSPTLYRFLKEKQQHATHFFIGSNILQYHDYFQTVWLDNQDDIAVHTWTHPYMTTKTNEEVLAELGWTMQLIHNSTGGRVPKYWRPPYGDSDTRVRAIAQEVFGLTTVVWNQDTNDWSLSDPVPLTSLDQIASQMHTWLTGPKTPGLIILEHELSDQSVQAFMSAWDLMVSNGWKIASVAQMGDVNAYQNAWNATSPVAPARIGEISIHPPPASPTPSLR
ncbi:carbohydrate esterase family 4 protein [Scleroderma citrinum]